MQKKTKKIRMPVAIAGALATYFVILASASNGVSPAAISSSSSKEGEGNAPLTTFQAEIGDEIITLNGVTSKNGGSLTYSIVQALNSESKEAVKFSDPTFVDADKYTYTTLGFDSFHCWLASTSNILRISNWAEDFVNPLIPERSDSYEDDLLAFFTSSLSDAGGSSEWALSYFFDGMLGKTVSSGGADVLKEKTALKPSPAPAFAGYLPTLCSQSLASSISLSEYPEALAYLEELDSNAIEASITKYDTKTKETLAGSSHSLTVVGSIVDQSKVGKERYKALLIADSDNEPCVSSLPTSFEEANQVKKEKTNSYTLYYLDTFDGKFGFYYNDTFAELDELTVLPFKNEQLISKNQEKVSYASCDKNTNADLYPKLFTIYSDGDYSGTYKVGDKLDCTFAYKNRNENCSMNKENAKKDTLQNSISVYRNQQYVGNIKEGLSYDLNEEIKSNTIIYGNLCLSDSNLFNAVGEYSVYLDLNTNGCEEAYALNNKSIEATFKIV